MHFACMVSALEEETCLSSFVSADKFQSRDKGYYRLKMEIEIGFGRGTFFWY